MELGKTYYQQFANGDRVFFIPVARCKNGSWKGRAWERRIGSRKPSKETQAFVYHVPLWTLL
jgi:hypothetical protein